MVELPHLLAASLLWTAALYKLTVLRRSPANPALRAHVGALLALALAVTVFMSPVYRGLDALMDVPNFAELLGHSLVVVGAWQAQVLLLHLSQATDQVVRQRRRGAVVAVTLAGLATLFALAPVDQEAPGSFTALYGDDPHVAGYWLVLLTYMAIALVDVMRLCLRYAGVAPGRRHLSLGLRLIAAGAALGLAYFAQWGAYLVMRRLGLGELPRVVSDTAPALFAAALGLVVVGSTLPAVGPRLERTQAAQAARRWRAHHQLYPLWRALYDSTPEIALLPARSRAADALSFRDLELRLYRRVIEIQDGRLALRPYLDLGVLLAARREAGRSGLRTGQDLDAAVEAARLAAALRAKSQGQQPDAPQDEASEDEADLAAEVRWWIAVSRAFVHSPIVASFRRGTTPRTPVDLAP